GLGGRGIRALYITTGRLRGRLPPRGPRGPFAALCSTGPSQRGHRWKGAGFMRNRSLPARRGAARRAGGVLTVRGPARSPGAPLTSPRPGMMTRAKAPLRISFCGGGTDIAEYFCEHGGVVLNATITKYAYATLVSRDDQRIILRSVDYGSELQYNPGEALTYDGDLDLAKAAIKRIGVHSGVELFLHTDAPPGSGLGSSSTLTAAIIGAFQEHFKLPPNPYHTAELAYAVEREELGLHGGKQDQYAAVFGGINFI